MRHAIYLFFVIVILTIAWSVASVRANTEQWRPVSKEDLELKDNPAQPGADAMILYREDFVNEKYVDQDGVYIDEYLQAKIFTDKGVKWGDVEIPFSKENSDVTDLKARTIEPDGSVVDFEGKPFEKTIVKKNGSKFLAKTFTLPDVKPGCIVEYRYRLQYKPHYLWDEYWTVSQELFTREARFSILPYVPRSFDSNYPLFFRLSHLSKDYVPKQQTDGSYVMTATNIPGIEDEPLMLPAEELEARVEFFHRDQDSPTNETTDHFWMRTGKKWDEDLEHFINKKQALEQDLAQTVSSNDPPDVKLAKIYARVQKIRDLSLEENRTKQEMKEENLKEDSNVEDVLKNGYATERQIDFLYIGLVRAAGFQATSVYLAPRSISAFHPEAQDPSEISHDDVVWVKAGGKEYYLDPACSACPFNMLPWYETGTQGLRVSKQGSEVVRTPSPQPDEAATIRTADLEVEADGSASGKLTADFTGFKAITYRGQFRKEDETGRKKDFEEILQGQMPSGTNIEVTKIADWDDISKPVHVEATFKMSEFGSPTGHRLLMPSTVFQEEVVQDFSAQTRSSIIYFYYPFEVNDTLTLHPPAGYKVESLPGVKKNDPGIVMYELTPTQQGDTVVIKRHLSEGGMIYDVKYYAALRAFFQSVKSNDDSQIVLETATSTGN